MAKRLHSFNNFSIHFTTSTFRLQLLHYVYNFSISSATSAFLLQFLHYVFPIKCWKSTRQSWYIQWPGIKPLKLLVCFTCSPVISTNADSLYNNSWHMPAHLKSLQDQQILKYKFFSPNCKSCLAHHVCCLPWTLTHIHWARGLSGSTMLIIQSRVVQQEVWNLSYCCGPVFVL